MKNLNQYACLLLLSIVPFLNSCTENTPDPIETPTAKYSDGVLVVNQGNFSDADGSLDFFDFEASAVSRSVYEKENDEAVGGIIEDVAFYNDKMYLISNVADRIIITDADSLHELSSLQGPELVTPRYFTASGDKGYVSVWGEYTVPGYTLDASSVAVLDLNSNSLLTTIPVPSGPEGIIALGNKVFVANSTTDTITVIDTQTDAVIKKIKTRVAPKHFVLDEAENLWVVYGSGFIAQIDPVSYEEERIIELQGGSPSGKIQLVENVLYYHTSQWDDTYTNTSNAVYKIDLSATELSEELVLEKQNMSTFAVDPSTGHLYAGIAAGAEPGTIVVFDQEGNEQDNFAAGRFPHELIFR